MPKLNEVSGPGSSDDPRMWAATGTPLQDESMGYPVKLYVYDLSNGMARNMSFQLTGKQIDGIWHTSVVVFGREVYYGPYNAGPGIQVVLPGQSHHGRPLKIEDMGETDLDEDTFWEYISEIQQEWTGDKVAFTYGGA
ncbi:hypothetical protein FRC01_006394 [Tulasnella sp. 417]|nr:hypothetical protein FRC01_006394 [Tulasnella sp. 417]